MVPLWRSIKTLLIGMVSRFWLWLPLILLDISDYWEKYLRPGVLYVLSKDISMPPGTLVAIAICGFLWSAVLTYHDLRSEYLKLTARLIPTVVLDSTPRLQDWINESSGIKFRNVYLTVRNVSAVPMRNVTVYLVAISPTVSSLDWLPVPLHIKHNNVKPFDIKFDLNPSGSRLFDVITYQAGTNGFVVEHAVEGVNRVIPVGEYLLSIRVEGEGVTAACEEKFLVKLDRRKSLVCLPAKFIDFDKGQVEMGVDAARIAKERLYPALEDLTARTLELATIADRLATEIEEAQSKPIAWHERLRGINSSLTRTIRLSPKWSHQIDMVASKLRTCSDDYRLAARDFQENIAGYAELADDFADGDIAGYRQVYQAATIALSSLQGFRNQVQANQNMRKLTHMTRSMRQLGATLDEVIQETAQFQESFAIVIELMEEKRREKA